MQYHNTQGRPLHSRHVLRWNGQYVLYDLHFPPAASLPIEVSDNGKYSSGGPRLYGGHVEGLATSVCGRKVVFRSNGGLVSPSGQYTLVQHNGE